NMAIDEALLEHATVASIRFYRWHSPALSFGYFGRFADVGRYAAERELVRRWTGGGTVFHGNDLTYSIVIPANDAAFAESSMSIYEKIHRALADALAETGQRAVVAAIGDRGSLRSAIGTGERNCWEKVRHPRLVAAAINCKAAVSAAISFGVSQNGAGGSRAT